MFCGQQCIFVPRACALSSHSDAMLKLAGQQSFRPAGLSIVLYAFFFWRCIFKLLSHNYQYDFVFFHQLNYSSASLVLSALWLFLKCDMHICIQYIYIRTYIHHYTCISWAQPRCTINSHSTQITYHSQPFNFTCWCVVCIIIWFWISVFSSRQDCTCRQQGIHFKGIVTTDSCNFILMHNIIVDIIIIVCMASLHACTIIMEPLHWPLCICGSEVSNNLALDLNWVLVFVCTN